MPSRRATSAARSIAAPLVARAGAKSSLPQHIGFIPDGNRRWARGRGLPAEAGYERGIAPGIELFELCKQHGIPEVTVYGFTQDNTRRPAAQTVKYCEAVVAFAREIEQRGAALLVVGDDRSPLFPQELETFRARRGNGLRVNLLVNYGWRWDLDGLRDGELRSACVPRMDLIVRWGGGRRLSGFLPAQSVYADIFVVDALWPDFEPGHFAAALEWFGRQDRTLGG